MAVRDEVLPKVYVQPGESHLVAGPAIMRTVLGSCIGITFSVLRLGIGALCHPMLPRYPARATSGSRIAAGHRHRSHRGRRRLALAKGNRAGGGSSRPPPQISKSLRLQPKSTGGFFVCIFLIEFCYNI